METMTFNKILVPLDGSELADQALEIALALVAESSGEVLLVGAFTEHHLVATTTTGVGMEVVAEPTNLSQRHLGTHLEMARQKAASEQATRGEGAQPRVHVDVLLAEGDAASVIVDTALAEEVDLIVMSTHGRSGISRWLLGSVTEKVMRSAPCPLLAVRRAGPLEHILITLDGSAASETALAPGLAVAKRLGSRVTLLSVEPDDEVDPRLVAELDEAEMGLGSQLNEDFYRRTDNYMQDVVTQVRRGPWPPVETAIKSGRPANAILRHIESKDVDMVVMATHGRTGLRRWVYGSVTAKVLRSADCALLVVRPPDSGLS